MEGKRRTASLSRYNWAEAVNNRDVVWLWIGLGVTMVLSLAIAGLALSPQDAVGGLAGSDKLHHVLAFAVLAFPIPLVRPSWAIWVAIAVVAYGGAIELIQPAFGRHAEFLDFVADSIGAVIGAGLGFALSRYAMPDGKE